MENNQFNQNLPIENGAPEIKAEAMPAPPEAYEVAPSGPTVAAPQPQPVVQPQPLSTPAQAPAAAAPYVPAVHAVSPVNPNVQIKKSGKGLAAFAILVVLVLVLTIGAGAGFILGREYNNLGGTEDNTIPQIQLEAKPDSGEQYTTESIYNVVSQSVVRIAVYSDDSTQYSFASGVVYSENGYIVTNDHIYEERPNAKFIVQTNDGRRFEGSFVAGDTRSDLAVLKINAEGLVPAVFGDSQQISVGESVVAVGNPDGAEKSVATGGIVSAVNIWVSGNSSYSNRVIQTDAALNPGSSGGALVNAYGQVIGITSSKIIADDTDLVNYAIPTAVVKRVVDSLIENGYVTGRAMLGITYSAIGVVESDMMDYPSGLYIQSITQGGALDGKGLAKGDIITHVNGKEITSQSVMLEVLENTAAGSAITIKVYTANGATKEIEVTLQEYVGSSSYVEGDQGSNKEFNFPIGE